MRSRAMRGIALLLGIAASAGAWAEGSRSLYPSSYNASGFRATMDLRSNGTYMGVIPARQFLYVYAEANEYILLGSRNRNNGTGGDIVVYNPQDFGTKGAESTSLTANFSCVQTTPPAGSYSGTTLGQIGTRANELAGPNSADNSVTVTDGYAPCAYRAPVTGIYGVRFSGGASGTSVDGSVATPQLLSQQVSAWDVTVRANATSTTDLDGRLFTYAWVGYTGSNPRSIYHTLYYTTLDGYRYRQTMQGIDPNAYALYANSAGFLDEGSPLYKDIRGSSQFVDTGFPAGVTAQRPQFPIFFNDISPTGANAAQVNKVFTYLGIPSTPPVPELSGVSFEGNAGGSTSTIGAGGKFEFTTVNTVSYQIVISAGTDYDPGNVNNRVLTGTAGTGTHTVIWDGKNNAGTNFAVGGPYAYRVTGRNGEIHFPIIDTEGNANGGPTMTKLNGTGDSTVYYDDRSYVTRRNVTVGTPINGNLCGGSSAQVPPSPPYNLLGVDSSVANAGRYYRWWTASGNSNSDCSNSANAAFGDAKGLDLWAYASTGDVNELLEIIAQEVTRDLGTAVAVDATASPGQTVYGSLQFRNDGNGAATVSSATATIGTPGNCPASVTFTYVPPGLTAVYSPATCAVTFTGIGSMSAGQQYLFRFTYPAPASGIVPVTTTIAGNETAGATSPNTASGITTITVADVSAAVSVPATAPVGSTVAGTITFANGAPGNATANAVVYTARIGTPGSCPANVAFPTPPAGVTLSYNSSTCDVLFSGMPTQLAIGQSVPITFTYTAPASGTVPVTATIATPTAQVSTSNDTANGSTSFFVPNANVGIVKTAPSAIAAGDVIIYMLYISNVGPDAAHGTTYSDVVPAGITSVGAVCGGATSGAVCANPTVAGNTVSGTVPTLPNGGHVTITITGVASGSATTLNNTATVTPPPGTTDPTPGNNTSTTTTNVVAIVANDNNYGPVNGNSGNPNVGNVLGNDTVDGVTATPTDVILSVVTPASHPGVTMGPGGDVRVAPGTPPGTYTIVYRICAFAAPTICDTATVTVDVFAPSANIGVVKNGPANVAASGAISYTLVVGNAGPDAADGTTYADAVPVSITGVAASCGNAAGGAVCANPSVAGNNVSGTVPTLPSGGSVTITITGTAPATSMSLSNTATVTPPPGTTDPTPGNNTSTTTTQVDASSSLAIAKTNGVPTYTPGTTATYSLTVTNAGPSTATGVVVTDTLPSGVTLSGTPTCVSNGDAACGTIAGAVGTASFGASGASVGAAAGDSLVYSLPVRYDAAMVAATVTNTASVSAPSDPSGPHTASDTDTRAAVTALAVVKSDNSATYTPGSTASYVVTVTNAGPSDAHGVGVTDTLPAGVTLTGAPTCAANGVAVCGTVSNTTTSFTASGGSIAAGTGNALVFTLPVAFASNLAADPLVNTATATDPSDPDGASGSDSNTRVATSGLSIAKTDNSATYTPGGTATYVITVQNSGPSDANAISVSDTLPAGVTVSGTVTCAVSGTASCGTISVTGGNTLSATGASIVAGAGNSIAYSVPVTFAASLTTSPLVNTATASDPQDPSGPHTATDTSTIAAVTALAVAKTDGALSYTPGTSGTYTITVTNAGPSDAHDVDVTDTLPAGVTLSGTPTCAATGTATCGTPSNTATSFAVSNGTIAAGAGNALVVTLPVAFAPNLATNPLVNTATATDPQDPDGASGSDTNSLNALTGLNITKTDGATTYVPGGTATYTIVVTNAGPSDATGVVVNDPLPAGVTLSAAATCVASGSASCGTSTGAAGATSAGLTGGAIAAGTGNALTLSLPVNFASDLTANPLANTVSVHDAADPTPRTATDSNAVAFAPGLTIDKDDGETSYTPGGTGTYVIMVRNTGPSDATGISVTDTLRAGVTLAALPTCTAIGAALCGTVNGTVGGSDPGISAASLPAGAANALRLSVPVQFAANLTVNPLVNTATASEQSGATPVSDSDSNARVGAGSLQVTKTDGSATYVPGGTATYTIVVTNTGVTDASDVSVLDPLPAGVTIAATPTCVAAGAATCGTIVGGAVGGNNFAVSGASVPAGAGHQLTYSLPVRFDADLATNPLVNTVRVTDSSSPSATASDSNTPSAQVGLQLAKTDNSATYTPGGTAVYVITLGNTGPSNASGIALADPLPAGVTLTAAPTCVAAGTATCGSVTGAAGGTSFAVANASVAAGAGNTLTFTLPVSIASNVAANPLVNTVTATAPGSSGASASDNSALLATTGLTVTKDDGATSYVPGGNTVYVIEVANGGPSNANAIALADPLPAGVTLTATPTCTVVGTGACGTITGAAGGSHFAVAAASLGAGATNRLRYSVPVAFAANMTANPLVNTVSATDPSDPQPHTASDSNVRDAQADLGIVKTGPASAERGERISYSITVTNAGPSDATNVQVVDPTPPGLTYVSSSAPCAGGFPCDLGAVANGASVTFDVVYDIDRAYAGTSIVNTATVSSDTTDPNGSNASSSSSTPLGDVADVVVTKTGPATATSLQSVAYVVTVRNDGPSSALGVVLNDPTPAGLVFVSASAPCAAGFPCAIGDLAAGQSVAVTVNYTVRATAVAVTVENVATATSTTPDSSTGNNSGAQVTQVTGRPASPPVAVPAGSWLTLLLTAFGLGALAWQRRRIAAQ